MGALSEADHNWFIERMEEGASVEQMELVEEDLGHLKQLYTSYRNGLKQLHQIAQKYETTRRNIKVKLRLQQKAARQENL
ncbi:hypothetical protein GM418_21030 [Maribellus comscasis]|uniref:Uncharacterized protein n=1 Tax=Maribellus comscasis TaxID=2681766 RepID=A0A6I6JY43_9BACT|nr:hypothetical protein [Maribellus comscasis]QGY46060.1 hypothetical protein GM418_21030 [Maribellus comscasis]